MKKRTRCSACFSLAVVAAALAGGGLMWAITRPTERGGSQPEQPVQAPAGRFEEIPPEYATGVTNPPLVAAGQARLFNDALVIGFIKDGKAFALRKSSMSAYGGHIQRFTGLGVAIVHCNRTDQTRILKAPPIDLRIAGFEHGIDQMVVKVGAQSRLLREIGTQDFEEMTWEQWRTRHPNTRVMDLDAANLHSFITKPDVPPTVKRDQNK